MPSSMIFGGLVIVWLLILVPTVARHRQEVARPSEAALAGRVLERPKRPEPEVDDLHRADESDEQKTRPSDATKAAPSAVATVERYDPGDEPASGTDDDSRDDDRHYDHPAPRYRRGRGGFDAEAAAYAARARATFRQRVVLTLLIGAVVSAVVAIAALPVAWWLHLVLDVALVGYLSYLRRQVRMEEAIRERRAARMAGSARRRAAADLDGPEPDHRAAHGRIAIPEQATEEPVVEEPAVEEPAADLLLEEPERVAGTGAPLPRIVTSLDELTVESALPRLQPAPPPPIPAGTVLVEELEDDPELHDLDDAPRHDYRRAAGA